MVKLKIKRGRDRYKYPQSIQWVKQVVKKWTCLSRTHKKIHMVKNSYIFKDTVSSKFYLIIFKVDIKSPKNVWVL